MSDLTRRFAVAAAALLMSAPVMGPIRGLARQCASGCPMHVRQKLHCHGGTMAAHTRQPSTARQACATAAITPPGCACGHGDPTMSMYRAVLSVPALLHPDPVCTIRCLPVPQLQSRVADPPEPPPPILGA